MHVDLSRYDGIVIDVTESSDHKRYALTIKDNVPSRRGDGRLKSTVTWEAEFTPSGSDQIFLPWDDFKATYRGKDRPDEKPLDLTNIRRMGLMMRRYTPFTASTFIQKLTDLYSFFDKQDGDFSITLRSIAARRGGTDDAIMKISTEQHHDEKHYDTERSSWKRLFCGLF